jgi:adenosine deaminase
VEKLPKCELHVHLEGAVPGQTLCEIARKYGVHPPPVLASDTYDGYDGFVAVWRDRTRLLRECEDFTVAAEAAVRALARCNVAYAELHFSIGSAIKRLGLPLADLVHAVRKGMASVAVIETALIVDLVRDHGPKSGTRLLDELIELGPDAGVVAVGLGGNEARYPIGGYAPIFERARRAGLHTVAHAGEFAGPANVWTCLSQLRPERIGHGWRASEDNGLVAHLALHTIPLEVCVTSNLRLGLLSSPEAHPAALLRQQGVPLTVGSDDPDMFGIDLVDEYCLLHSRAGFDVGSLVGMARDAFEFAFLPPERRAALLRVFDHVAQEALKVASTR